MGGLSGVSIDEGQLRSLRCYLRAVFGDQASGDALASVLARYTRPAGPGLVSLFGAATRTWRRLSHGSTGRAFSARTLTQGLSAQHALCRQAGVLVDVFGLTTAQAAEVLDRSPGEVTYLLSAVRRERRMAPAASVLIVEDEPMVATHLAGLARAEGASEVRTAASCAEAIQAVAASKPDVVLCDYALGPGPNGIELVQALSAEHDLVTIFVTGHPEAVLTGSDHEPSFIIAKPFRDETVRAALYFAASAERPQLVAA